MRQIRYLIFQFPIQTASDIRKQPTTKNTAQQILLPLSTTPSNDRIFECRKVLIISTSLRKSSSASLLAVSFSTLIATTSTWSLFSACSSPAKKKRYVIVLRHGDLIWREFRLNLNLLSRCVIRDAQDEKKWKQNWLAREAIDSKCKIKINCIRKCSRKSRESFGKEFNCVIIRVLQSK